MTALDPTSDYIHTIRQAHKRIGVRFTEQDMREFERQIRSGEAPYQDRERDRAGSVIYLCRWKGRTVRVIFNHVADGIRTVLPD